MIYSTHASKRMEQRNFNESLIETSLEDFYKFGTWNAKGDRLTLDGRSNEFHERIESLENLCQKTFDQLKRACRIKSDKAPLFSINKIKKAYRALQKKLKYLKKIEHKGRITLVIEDNVLITVFKETRRSKKNYDFYI